MRLCAAHTPAYQCVVPAGEEAQRLLGRLEVLQVVHALGGATEAIAKQLAHKHAQRLRRSLFEVELVQHDALAHPNDSFARPGSARERRHSKTPPQQGAAHGHVHVA